MRVILIKGQSEYDALRVFIDDLGVAFAERGYEPVVLDLMDPQVGAAMAREAAAGPTELVFSFNILGEFRDQFGRSIGEIFGAPHVLQHVDYPLTSADRIDHTRRDTALLVVDQTHVDAIRDIYGADHFAHVAFSPHAGIGKPAAPEPDPEAFAQARPIPILFTGTFYKPAEIDWRPFAASTRPVFERALDVAMSDEFVPALQALDRALVEAGRDPKDLVHVRKHATLIHEYVRSHRRFEVLKRAAKLGLPIHVCGKGYEKHLYRFKNIVYGGPAGLNDAIALMRQSRIVLNVNANFGAGSHERPLTAQLAGAVAASDHSRFYERAFTAGEEMVLYRWTTLDDDLAAVGALAGDPAAAFPIARAGAAKAAAEHRWRNRIDTILAAAEAVRARTRIAA